MSKITVCVQFLCTECKQPLTDPGAALTADDHIYFTGRCEICDVDMPIDLEQILAVLYQTPSKDRRVN